MGLNINQLPTAATSILATDKMYLGRSPFGATDDRYILGSSIIAQFADSVYANVTTATQAIDATARYIANYVSGLLTFTLPLSADVGSCIEIIGSSSSGWTIAQNSSQIIHINSVATTTGIGGSVSSTNRYNSIKLVCILANTECQAVPNGNLTVV